MSTKYTAKDMVFENFKEQVEHLYKYIYQGIKHFRQVNPSMEVEFKYTGNFFSDPSAFKVSFHHIGEWQLNFDATQQLVSLTSPLTHHTEYYKYDQQKDDWVHAKQPHKKDSLLLKLYQELDAHSEGYPYFGVEDHFWKR